MRRLPSGVCVRSFVKGEGDERRFVEISRHGREVEVTRGKVGGRGHSRERVLATEALAETFVAEEVRKLVRDGYVEGAADEPEAQDEPDDPVAAEAEKAARELMRTTYVPRLTGGKGSGSQLGGAPLLAAGEPWPACAGCRTPMQHLLQLRVAELPEPARAELGGGDDLVQLFYAHCDCDPWEPYSKAHLARRIPASAARVATAGPAELRIKAKPIVDWTPTPELPRYAEFELLEGPEDEVLDALLERPEKCLPGEKLTGWPHWVQSAAYPKCRTCKSAMRFVFQIDSNRELPVQFGDSGAGHLFVCRKHPQVLAFMWQCC